VLYQELLLPGVPSPLLPSFSRPSCGEPMSEQVIAEEKVFVITLPVLPPFPSFFFYGGYSTPLSMDLNFVSHFLPLLPLSFFSLQPPHEERREYEMARYRAVTLVALPFFFPFSFFFHEGTSGSSIKFITTRVALTDLACALLFSFFFLLS